MLNMMSQPKLPNCHIGSSSRTAPGADSGVVAALQQTTMDKDRQVPALSLPVLSFERDTESDQVSRTCSTSATRSKLYPLFTPTVHLPIPPNHLTGARIARSSQDADVRYIGCEDVEKSRFKSELFPSPDDVETDDNDDNEETSVLCLPRIGMKRDNRVVMY